MQSILSSGRQSQPLQARLSSLTAFLLHGTKHFKALTGGVPPSSLILLSSFAAQLGVAIAKDLFDVLGPLGATFLKTGVGAILLLLIWRPQLRHHRYEDYILISLFGLTIAGMSVAFFEAVDRVPLGIASAVEFVGPLGVAVLGSRQWLDAIWITLAAIGLILLAPISGAPLSAVGIAFALLSGGCWAIHILMSNAVGRAFPGGAGLALAMTIAAILLLPMGIHQGGIALLKPSICAIGIVVALFDVVVPYSLDFKALKSLPPRIFGVLISIEPAIAALVGFLVLGEQLSIRTLAAIALVTIAAMGITLFGHHEPNR
ncbi:EamA family transporter [Oculatella sp. LEGE 06141]|uniref:EamA family transporter n=1 Tax=Oculatella sp. LEGE 06141 TaxID=1828648 RepID=UPI001881EAC7|nr:EamA family transporter [Oculatella sp. LEGE 06141]MBE9182019.1 EamA family transporter [Oculatella sp. LEGE 06141]